MFSRLVGNKKIWFLGYMIIVSITAALVCFGNNGFVHLFKMKRELYELNKKNKALTKENTELFKRIQLFTSNRFLQEEAIRKELGWVKDGEIVIDFPRRHPQN